MLAVSAYLAVAMMTGCGSDDDSGGDGIVNTPTRTATPVSTPAPSSPTPGSSSIEDFVSDLRISGRDDLVAVLMPGSPPAESGGPFIGAPTAATVDPGITTPVLIISDEVYSTLLLAIPGSSGYWVLDFGSLSGGAGTSTDLQVDVTFGTNPPSSTFDCLL